MDAARGRFRPWTIDLSDRYLKPNIIGLALGAVLALMALTAVAWADETAVDIADEEAYLKALIAASLANTRGDVEAAYKVYLPLAEVGHAEAQYSVGFMVANGSGVEKDMAGAAVWYQRAAEQNHKVAQLRFGLMLRDGEGVEKDLIRAHMWLSLAAQKGPGEARDHRNALAAQLEDADLSLSQDMMIEWIFQHGDAE